MRNDIMSDNMRNPRDHALLLGKIVANIQAIEFIMRDLLFVKERGVEYVKRYNETLKTLNSGDLVEINSLTNYDTLNKLVANYNNLIKFIDTNLCIDNDIVTLRNVIAHGRVFGLSALTPPLLMKFSQPMKTDKSIVKVTYNVEMTPQWFREQLKLTTDIFGKVKKAHHLICAKYNGSCLG